jgi:hypothetical protein
MYERILVPVDGSETSKRGLKEASRLAKEQGARLKCLHVIDEHFLAYDTLGFAYMPGLFEALRKNGETILDEAKHGCDLRSWNQRSPGHQQLAPGVTQSRWSAEAQFRCCSYGRALMKGGNRVIVPLSVVLVARFF